MKATVRSMLCRMVIVRNVIPIIHCIMEDVLHWSWLHELMEAETIGGCGTNDHFITIITFILLNLLVYYYFIPL